MKLSLAAQLIANFSLIPNTKQNDYLCPFERKEIFSI
jgi:hypothetical protein